MDRTAQLVGAVSKPGERHPWIDFGGPMGRREKLDPAAAKAELCPKVGDDVYVVTSIESSSIACTSCAWRTLPGGY